MVKLDFNQIQNFSLRPEYGKIQWDKWEKESNNIYDSLGFIYKWTFIVCFIYTLYHLIIWSDILLLKQIIWILFQNSSTLFT